MTPLASSLLPSPLLDARCGAALRAASRPPTASTASGVTGPPDADGVDVRAARAERLRAELGTGREAMVLLQCVESDPKVVEARVALRQGESALTQGISALAGGRDGLFQARPDRARSLHDKMYGRLRATCSLGGLGVLMGTPVAAGALFGAAASTPALLLAGVVFLCWVGNPPISMNRLSDRIVEHSLRREVRGEVKRAEAQVPHLQNGYDEARSEALAYYTAYLAANPSAPRGPAPEAGEIKREDQHVMLGGVRVAIKRDQNPT